MSEARAATFAAHATREADRSEARAAAYAVKAAARAADAMDPSAAAAEERDWQYQRLPEHLRPVTFPSRGDD